MVSILASCRSRMFKPGHEAPCGQYRGYDTLTSLAIFECSPLLLSCRDWLSRDQRLRATLADGKLSFTTHMNQTAMSTCSHLVIAYSAGVVDYGDHASWYRSIILDCSIFACFNAIGKYQLSKLQIQNGKQTFLEFDL